MGDDVDRRIGEHIARMPDSHRQLLEPVLAADAAPDAWPRDALLPYLRHWTRLFELEEPREDAEEALADELAALTVIERAAGAQADVERAEAILMTGFRERGLEFLGGRTPPYLGPYVWTRTERRAFEVALPRADAQPVTVHLMHDFLVRGWLHWRTFGEQGAGGWYQQDDPDWPDGLYAVAERYGDLDTNPAFQVSLLRHEAQHVADHHEFPGLSSGELEYRAKLVELMGYERGEQRLDFFLTDAADEPEQPHPWAAHRIVAELAARLPELPADRDAWMAVPYHEIRRHAGDLLDEDTARLASAAKERIDGSV